jgi:hypothetical protein
LSVVVQAFCLSCSGMLPSYVRWDGLMCG